MIRNGGTIKAMMETEMDRHLGCEKSKRSDSENARNGYKLKLRRQMKYKENLTKKWRAAFLALDGALREEARALIAANNFSEDIVAQLHSAEVREVLHYYQIRK